MSENKRKTFFTSGDLLSISEAAEFTPYSAAYLSLRARTGHLKAVKIGRNWLTTKQAVKVYLSEQESKYMNRLSFLRSAQKEVGFIGIKALLKVLVVAIIATEGFLISQSVDFQPKILLANWQAPKTVSFALSEAKDYVHYFRVKTNEAVLNLGMDMNRDWDFIGLGLSNAGNDIKNDALFAAQNFLQTAKQTKELAVGFWDGLVKNVGLLDKYARNDFGHEKAASFEAANSNSNLVHESDLSSVDTVSQGQNIVKSGFTSGGGEGNRTPRVWNDKSNPAPSHPNQTLLYHSKPQVLGETVSAADPNYINQLIDARLKQYLAEGKFKGEKGDTGAQGLIGLPGNSSAPAVFGYAAPNGPGGQGAGTILGGTYLSGNVVKVFESLSITGPVTQSGGAVSLATSTISTLTVSGLATFSGSTTIAGLTVTGLNPGLTAGSVLFQGSSAILDDNTNFYWDDTNNRLGIGTSSPASTLYVQGSGSTNPFQVSSSTGTGLMVVTNTGNVGIGTTAPDSKLSVLGTATQLKLSYDASNYQTFTVGSTGNLQVARNGAAATLALTDVGVGIGTTTPTARLNVTSSGTVNPFSISSSSGVTLLSVDSLGNFNLATLTASSLVMSDAGKNLASVTLGAGLSINGSTLNTTQAGGAWTVGSGVIYNATSTDLVGIGTITPITTLFVQGKGGTNPFAIASSTGTQLLTVTQSGNVGVGTSGPISRLSVSGGSINVSGASSTAYMIEGITILHAQGSNNIFVGGLSAASVTGDNNAVLGYNAGFSLTSGTKNVFVGGSAGYANGSTGSNVYIGYNAAGSVGSGSSNVYIGESAGPSLGGSNNIIIGQDTAKNKTSGSSNTIIGSQAGFNAGTGGSSVFLGYQAGYSDTASNKLYIANNLTTTLFYGDFSSGYVNINGTNTAVTLAIKGLSTSPTNDLLDIASSSGTSYLRVTQGGNVGLGTTSPTAGLHVGSAASGKNVRIANGWLCVDDNDTCTGATTAGTIYATNGTVSGGADVAENYPTLDNSLEAGDVVMADEGLPVHVKKSSPLPNPLAIRGEGTSGAVIGVVSTKPGVLLGHNQDFGSASSVPVALAGRVPVKVTSENGSIKPGDYLTLSSTMPGYATKALKAGYVIGVALENYSNGNSTVLVFINKTYFVPKVADILQNGQDMGLSSDEMIALSLNESYAFSDLVVVNTVYIGKKLVVKERIETAELIANTVTAKEKLCVGETCVTEEQLKAVLELINQPGGSAAGQPDSGQVAGASVPPPVEEPAIGENLTDEPQISEPQVQAPAETENQAESVSADDVPEVAPPVEEPAPVTEEPSAVKESSAPPVEEPAPIE